MRTLDYLRGHRIWFVPNFSVWGESDATELLYLAVESIDGDARVSFGAITLDGKAQDVLYSDLTDFRGNQLPSVINSPRVIIRPQSSSGAFVVNQESNSGFRIARDKTAPDAVMADLFIIEMD